MCILFLIAITINHGPQQTSKSRTNYLNNLVCLQYNIFLRRDRDLFLLTNLIPVSHVVARTKRDYLLSSRP